MNKDLTDITIVLDKSGSMCLVKDDTIGGFNTFVEEQKKQAGHANLTFVQFDTNYEFVYRGVPIQAVEPLTSMTYKPSGNTALLDAVGRAIDETGSRHPKPASVRRWHTSST